jgi:hypothetical protein
MIRSSNRNLTFSFLSWLLNLYEKASSQAAGMKAAILVTLTIMMRLTLSDFYIVLYALLG